MPAVSYTEAAKLAGVSKSSISRAVKDGRLSRTLSDTGRKAIDLTELERVFPPSKKLAGDRPDAPPPPTQALLDAKEEQIAEMQAALEALEQERDTLQKDLLTSRQQHQAALFSLEEVRRRWMALKPTQDGASPTG